MHPSVPSHTPSFLEQLVQVQAIRDTLVAQKRELVEALERAASGLNDAGNALLNKGDRTAADLYFQREILTRAIIAKHGR
jgi:hypothetical protein